MVTRRTSGYILITRRTSSYTSTRSGAVLAPGAATAPGAPAKPRPLALAPSPAARPPSTAPATAPSLPSPPPTPSPRRSPCPRHPFRPRHPAPKASVARAYNTNVLCSNSLSSVNLCIPNNECASILCIMEDRRFAASSPPLGPPPPRPLPAARSKFSKAGSSFAT